jgi:hypothetical protein
VDPMGIKVDGERKWKLESRDRSKRRFSATKLQIGVDEATGEIIAAAATTDD